ncbi:MAG TPA: SDR family oxidoreductase [Patescibacteria group bacterium]|nr:SDR family oxidoreductase [Patescibacteria group bacterium]
MELGLAEKVVVITGGSDGIGKACALKFLQEGCKVAICARNKEKLAAAAKECSQLGFSIIAASVDVVNGRDVENFAATVAAEYGRIDVWINNAGFYPQKLVMDMEENEWDEVMDTNLKSIFIGAKTAAKYMKKQKSGVILNAASIAAFFPSVGSGAYATSKAAVLCFTKVVAGELAPWNIRVASYVPGLTETEMTKQVIQQNRAKLTEQIPLNRVGTADEIAEAVVFLASDAARYITGTHIEVSGGKLCVQNSAAAWKQADL